MKIRYRVTEEVREVEDAVAQTLIARNIADAVSENAEPRAVMAEPISQCAGKPKRRYKRRDMRAES